MRPPPTAWRRASSLTVEEVARVKGRSKGWAYALVESGALPAYRDHLGRLRIRPADLEVFLATEDDQPTLFQVTAAPQARWLHAIEADTSLDAEALAVARWLASETDEHGNLSEVAQELLRTTLEGT